MLTGLGILSLMLISTAVAQCDTKIFPTTPQKSYDSLFDAYWSNVFMVTPFLEDCKNSDSGLNWGWTKTGEGTLYHGSGFYRATTCKFGCDAKGECDMLDTCTISRKGASSACGGPGTDACSHCIADSPTAHCEKDKSDCTVVKLTPTMLPGREILGEEIADEEDCFRICKIEPRGYRLEAPVDGSFYGIPYKGKCPKGFDGVKNIIVSYNYPSWNNKATTEKKCILEGGVLGLSNFTIPDTEIDDGSDAKWDSGFKMTHKITHPAFTLIETGNTPFEIVWAGVNESDDDEYSVKRLYKPQDHSKEFVVNSDLVFNYTLLDSAKELRIEAKHTYITLLRTDIHRVACDEQVVSPEKCELDDSCSCSWHVSKEPTYQDFIRRGACGGTSTDRYSYCWYGCGSCEGESDCCCGCPSGSRVDIKKRVEKETLPPTRSIRTLEQEIVIPKVSHEKLTNNTKINITGIIDQFVDENGNRDISGLLDITLDPNILGLFAFTMNDAQGTHVAYLPVMYPVKHYLYRKFASPGDTTRVYIHNDSYGYECEEFNFSDQCRKTCPTKCSCPPDDPLNVSCINETDGSIYNRTDCACVPNECYPDPCISKRNFHEEQGLRIRNGEFEKHIRYCCPLLISLFKECEPGCDDKLCIGTCKYREYKNWAKTEGKVSWPVNGFSGHGVRLEDGGGIKQRITPVPLHTYPHNELCFMYALEECKSGGYLKLYVNGKRKLKLECDDYGPCDLPSGWTKQCVKLEVKENISSVEFKSKNIKVRLDNVNLGDYYDFLAVYTANMSSETKYFDIGGRDKDYGGLIMLMGDITENSTGDHRTSHMFCFEFLKFFYINSTGGWEEGSITIDNIRENATVTLVGHFRGIDIPLFPAETGHNANPFVNVTIREATRMEYRLEHGIKPYNVNEGEEVNMTVRLTDYDSGAPVVGEPIYIGAIEGVDILSPKSLLENSYINTSSSGEIKFSFKLRCQREIRVFFFGSKILSPTAIKVLMGSAEFRSPFFKGEFLASFLILILILVFTLLSFRFFRRRRVDFGQWWKDLRGEEEEE